MEDEDVMKRRQVLHRNELGVRIRMKCTPGHAVGNDLRSQISVECFYFTWGQVTNQTTLTAAMCVYTALRFT